jgi:hypothetical protein
VIGGSGVSCGNRAWEGANRIGFGGARDIWWFGMEVALDLCLGQARRDEVFDGRGTGPRSICNFFDQAENSIDKGIHRAPHLDSPFSFVLKRKSRRWFGGRQERSMTNGLASTYSSLRDLPGIGVVV